MSLTNIVIVVCLAICFATLSSTEEAGATSPGCKSGNDCDEKWDCCTNGNCVTGSECLCVGEKVCPKHQQCQYKYKSVPGKMYKEYKCIDPPTW